MMPPEKEDEGSVLIHDTKKGLKLAKIHGYISYNTSDAHTPLTLISLKLLRKKEKEFLKKYFNRKLSDQEKLEIVTNYLRFLLEQWK